MNKIHPNSPTNYPITYAGPSGPAATYPQVYDKIDNIPGQEVMSLLDFSTIREIRNLLKKKKNSSGNESLITYSNNWLKLKDQPAEKISIFNDTNQILEIKQTPLPSLINYNHSTSFAPEINSSINSGANPNVVGWGDFKTSVGSNYELTNFPTPSRNSLAYLDLPEDFDSKSWEVAFDITTTPPQDWTGWNPDWTLGRGYFLNIFNPWDNYPSPIGVLPSDLNSNSSARSRFAANENIGETTSKGYTLLISDPAIRSTKIADDLFPDFAITGAYFSGGGALSSSGTYNLILMTSGLNQNPLNEKVRLFVNSPAGVMFYSTNLVKNNNQVVGFSKAIGGTPDILNTSILYLRLEVEREYSDGLGGRIRRYVWGHSSALRKNGGSTLWGDFVQNAYPNDPPILKANDNLSNRARSIRLYYGDNLLSSSTTMGRDYPPYDSVNKVLVKQKGGLWGVYMLDNLGSYNLVLEYYDRHYYARSKVGNKFSIGSLISSSFGSPYHNVKNIYFNNQRVDLNSDASIDNYLNFNPSIPAIKLYPDTAIDLKIINTNQVFIKTTGQFQTLKYRWEN